VTGPPHTDTSTSTACPTAGRFFWLRVLVKSPGLSEEPKYYARLLARRDGHWSICGVLTLHEGEWNQLLRICEAAEIAVEIIHENFPPEAVQAPTID
jgi:hypothetical protein